MNAIMSDGDCVLLLLNRSAPKNTKALRHVSAIGALEASIQMPVHNCDVNMLDVRQLSTIIGVLNSSMMPRNSSNLLVAGAFLEDQIRVAALQALAESFDVYILNEFIISRQFGFVQTIETRLWQAGAVPTTLRQSLYQWMTAEPDPLRRSVLLQLIELACCRFSGLHLKLTRLSFKLNRAEFGKYDVADKMT